MKTQTQYQCLSIGASNTTNLIHNHLFFHVCEVQPMNQLFVRVEFAHVVEFLLSNDCVGNLVVLVELAIGILELFG